MVARTALCAALLLGFTAHAHALCRDDLSELKPRIDHVKNSSPQRYALALKWWGRAQEAEPGSEVECLNFAARVRKALTEPIPEIASCAGPNAYLPNCQNGVLQNGNMGMPPGGGPMLPIGGGGAGNGVTAVAPLTSGGTQTQFNSSGSIQAPSVSSPN